MTPALFCDCDRDEAVEVCRCRYKARVQELEAFHERIRNAWVVARDTTKPGSAFFFGQKLRRLVREALGPDAAAPIARGRESERESASERE